MILKFFRHNLSSGGLNSDNGMEHFLENIVRGRTKEENVVRSFYGNCSLPILIYFHTPFQPSFTFCLNYHPSMVFPSIKY